MSRGLRLPRPKDRGLKRYIFPIAYLGTIAITFTLMSKLSLYEIYFMGEGQTDMQILLLIGIGMLYFMPFYEGLQLVRKR
jgi:hypothetical protein